MLLLHEKDFNMFTFLKTKKNVYFKLMFGYVHVLSVSHSNLQNLLRYFWWLVEVYCHSQFKYVLIDQISVDTKIL